MTTFAHILQLNSSSQDCKTSHCEVLLPDIKSQKCQKFISKCSIQRPFDIIGNVHVQNPSHCEGFCMTYSKSFALLRSSVSVLSVLRSGLLTIFSSLVIQECLINFVEIIRSANDLEFNKSKTGSHCESVFVFCLSASHPRH